MSPRPDGPRGKRKSGGGGGKGKRLPRGAQRETRGKRADLDPHASRLALLADETGTIFREAPLKIALCYPLPYRAAMSSLGYQVIYKMLNSRPFVSAERVVLPDDVVLHRSKRTPPVSIETGRRVQDFDMVAFSVTWDLDVLGFFDLLELAGIPQLRSERGPHHPPVMIGGPLTASNPLPFGPFIDLAVIGDGEVAVERLLDVLESCVDRDDMLTRAAAIPGVWVPEIHGDRVPGTQKVTAGLPAYAQIVTPHTELSNMFLVEPSRGCPRACKFCLVRSAESPMRENDLERVLSKIPDHAQRVGLVGAAVSEWEHVREALRRLIAAGKGVGMSSLRADRLDEDFVDLLARGGYRTMTIASDAPSQRLRNKLAKGIRTKHLWEAARLAKAAGMLKLKLYVIVGLPGETDEDLDELIGFARELSELLPTALGLSPLVPKLHTPLGDAPFAGMDVIDATLKRLHDGVGGTAEIRSTSARWAWVEYRMSQGAQDAGLAAFEAWKGGGRFRAWEQAFREVEERGALRAARQHNLFQAAGMR